MTGRCGGGAGGPPLLLLGAVMTAVLLAVTAAAEPVSLSALGPTSPRMASKSRSDFWSNYELALDRFGNSGAPTKLEDEQTRTGAQPPPQLLNQELILDGINSFDVNQVTLGKQKFRVSELIDGRREGGGPNEVAKLLMPFDGDTSSRSTDNGYKDGAAGDKNLASADLSGVVDSRDNTDTNAYEVADRIDSADENASDTVGVTENKRGFEGDHKSFSVADPDSLFEGNKSSLSALGGAVEAHVRPADSPEEEVNLAAPNGPVEASVTDDTGLQPREDSEKDSSLTTTTNNSSSSSNTGQHEADGSSNSSTVKLWPTSQVSEQEIPRNESSDTNLLDNIIASVFQIREKYNGTTTQTGNGTTTSSSSMSKGNDSIERSKATLTKYSSYSSHLSKLKSNYENSSEVMLNSNEQKTPDTMNSLLPIGTSTFFLSNNTFLPVSVGNNFSERNSTNMNLSSQIRNANNSVLDTSQIINNSPSLTVANLTTTAANLTSLSENLTATTAASKKKKKKKVSVRVRRPPVRAVLPAVLNLAAVAPTPAPASPVVTEGELSTFDYFVRVVKHPSQLTAGVIDMANTVGMVGGMVSLSLLPYLVAGRKRRRRRRDVRHDDIFNARSAHYFQ